MEAKDVAGFMNQLTGPAGQTIKIFSKTEYQGVNAYETFMYP